MIPFASCSRGLVVPWACRLVVSWAFGLFHGQAVVFQFPDNEETLMAMENADTVMLIYMNPGSLDMAGTAEAGTAVLSRGLSVHIAE